MNNSKPIDKLEHYPGDLIEQLVTGRPPIDMYLKAIRSAAPYICFVYMDTDALPPVKDILLEQPNPYAHNVDVAALRPDLPVVFRGDSRRDDGGVPGIQAFRPDDRAGCMEATIPVGEQHASLDAVLRPNDQREMPVVRTITLDARAGFVDATLPVGEQHVSLDVSLRPNDQREMPVVRTITLDARAGFVDATLPVGEQHASVEVMLCPNDQREMPVVRTITLDRQSGFVEKNISVIEQKASSEAFIDLDGRRTEISIVPYVLEDKPSQYTNAATAEEQQHCSCHHSLAIIEPLCFDYRVSRAESRILGYRSYFRANHIAARQDE
jgi:hypothetical protein